MPFSDRRKQPRYNIWVNAEIFVSDNSLPGIATEISGDGVRIQSQKSILPGSTIRIELQLEEKAVIDGTVAWSLNTLVDTLNIYDMGVQSDIIYYEGIKVNKFKTRAETVKRILSRIK